MRHRKAGNRLGRTMSHRRALMRNMVSALVVHGKVETTLQKAKALRPVAERLISIGREDTLAGRRRAAALLMGKEPVKALFDDVGPRFAGRPGGYTRILRTRHRAGDAAPMAVIELVEQ
jgi:large subunit ribosomal protein L17